MKSELIVDVQPGDVSIALLEDSRLMSLQREARNIAYAVGDIYLAKVKKLMPGLNAAFVNVGYEKDAFLHYLDLGPNFATYSEFLKQTFADRRHVPMLSRMKMKPEIDKHGTITDQLESGRELLVQIVKEPISSKGPRLTTEINFTGRFMVLIPFGDKVSISQKIKSTEEKVRLRQLVSSIKPKNFSVIVRTSAEGKRVAELNNELKTLLKCWEDTCAKAQRQSAPSLVFEEESRIEGMLRDLFNENFEAIHVNDKETFDTIVKYVSLIAPDRKDIVKLYEKPEPIFDAFNVTRQIKSSFGKTVSFKSGAYIIIEHTEALHVIDVNSGNRTKADQDQETNALEVNLRAADEIARQLRLRDMGGIIVVDFIDMAKNEHRQALYDHMKEVMATDRARHNILPLSKFGLMQITRQRVRPALDVAVTEVCPSCFGKGEIQPSLLFTDTLLEKLEYATGELGLSNFTLYVHPFVDAYLRKGWLTSIYRRWRRKLATKFKLVPDQSLAYLQYRIVDANGSEVDVKQEKDTDSASLEKTRDKAASRGGQPVEDIIAASEALANEPREPKKKKKKSKPAAEKPAAEKPASEKPGDEEPAAKPAPKAAAKPKPAKEQASRPEVTAVNPEATAAKAPETDVPAAETSDEEKTQDEKQAPKPRKRQPRPKADKKDREPAAGSAVSEPSATGNAVSEPASSATVAETEPARLLTAGDTGDTVAEADAAKEQAGEKPRKPRRRGSRGRGRNKNKPAADLSMEPAALLPAHDDNA